MYIFTCPSEVITKRQRQPRAPGGDRWATDEKHLVVSCRELPARSSHVIYLMDCVTFQVFMFESKQSLFPWFCFPQSRLFDKLCQFSFSLSLLGTQKPCMCIIFFCCASMVVFSMIATDFNLGLIQVHLFLQNEDGTFYLTKFLLQSRGQLPPLTGLVIFRKKLQAVKGKNYVPEVTHTSIECWSCQQIKA